jgi:hypothetical protein
MILHGHVEKCKKCDFYLRRGDFIMFLTISQISKKKLIKYTLTTNSYDFARR